MRVGITACARLTAAPRRLPRIVAHPAIGPRLLSTTPPKRKSMAIPEGSAYAVLGVSRDVDKSTLHAVYKSLVRGRKKRTHLLPVP